MEVLGYVHIEAGMVQLCIIWPTVSYMHKQNGGRIAPHVVQYASIPATLHPPTLGMNTTPDHHTQLGNATTDCPLIRPRYEPQLSAHIPAPLFPKGRKLILLLEGNSQFGLLENCLFVKTTYYVVSTLLFHNKYLLGKIVFFENMEAMHLHLKQLAFPR